MPRGDIGIVSASGTGLQEVSTLIARLGGGVSHGIGVGGRDLDERVGARGMLAAIDMLDADPGTRTLVLISKPPAPRVAQLVMERVRKSPKRSVGSPVRLILIKARSVPRSRPTIFASAGGSISAPFGG